MAKWVRPTGPARQPAQKRAGRVGISNPSTRCNPACLARQFNGSEQAGPTTCFFFFFNFFMFKIKKEIKNNTFFLLYKYIYIYIYIYIYNKFINKRDGPARPKTGRVIVFGPFIDGRPTQPDPFLAGHWRAGPKWARLARFDTPNF